MARKKIEKNEKNVAWSPLRNIDPSNERFYGTDFLPSRSVDHNCLEDLRTTKTYRMPTSRKSRAR